MPTPARVNFIESNNWTGGAFTSFTSPNLIVTSGNTLIVFAGGFATGGESVTGVTDTAGNTYTKVAHVFNPSDKYRQEIWVAANVTGHVTNTVTATWSAAVAYLTIIQIQYSGLHPTTPLDDTEQYVGSAPFTTPTLTGTTADSVHLLMTRWGVGTTGFPAGFTEFTTSANSEVADKIVTGGAFSGTYTVTSAQWFVMAAIFKTVGAAAAAARADTFIVIPV